MNNIVANESTKVAELLTPGQYVLLVERQNITDTSPIALEVSMVSRVTECNDGVDNDNDGLVDLFDYGCVNGDSPSESTDPDLTLPACADRLDNDEDDQIDYPSDPDCTGAGDPIEDFLCQDLEVTVVTGNGGLYRYEPNGIEDELTGRGSSSGTITYAIRLESTSTIGS